MKHIIPVLACLFLTAGDWRQFRGPDGSAVSPETGLPVRWSPTENVRWKVALPGRGLSNPVIAGGRVYVTACSGFAQKRLHVLCFDAAAGAKLWERQFWATGSTQCNDKTSMAAPTPVTDGEHVYALFACGDLAALDRDGNLLWYRALMRDYPQVYNQIGMAASPVLHADVLIVPLINPGDSMALGLDTHTGQNRWKIARPRTINWVTPVVRQHMGRVEILFQSWGELTACDPATGRQYWTYAGEGATSVATPVIAGGLVVTPDGMALYQPGTEGTPPVGIWKATKLRTTYASMLAHQDRVYAINSASVLTCAEAAGGKVLWQHRLKGAYSASPVFAEGRLYLLNEDGLTTVVDVTGEPTVLATNALNETMLATPAIAGGAIILRSDQHLYCLSGGR
jgi:outer membrane protein assembly factor BamB